MSRYLSFLRRKVHGGHETDSIIGFDKKGKNSRPVFHNDVITEDESPARISINKKPNNFAESVEKQTSFPKSDDSDETPMSVVKGDLRLRAEVDDGLDEPSFDTSIDDVIEKAFSDLEISLLTDTLTGIQDDIGAFLGASAVEMIAPNNEDSVVIVTETTEEMIEVDTPPGEIDGDFADSSLGDVSKQDILRNEFTIKIVVPSENETNQDNSADRGTTVKNCHKDYNGGIKTSKSYDTFPSQFNIRQLRHSKSCQSFSNCFGNNENVQNKPKRFSGAGNSSEEEFDSAKENLSDDDLANVTRIYIPPVDDQSNPALNDTDCSCTDDTRPKSLKGGGTILKDCNDELTIETGKKAASESSQLSHPVIPAVDQISQKVANLNIQAEIVSLKEEVIEDSGTDKVEEIDCSEILDTLVTDNFEGESVERTISDGLLNIAESIVLIQNDAHGEESPDISIHSEETPMLVTEDLMTSVIGVDSIRVEDNVKIIPKDVECSISDFKEDLCIPSSEDVRDQNCVKEDFPSSTEVYEKCVNNDRSSSQIDLENLSTHNGKLDEAKDIALGNSTTEVICSRKSMDKYEELPMRTKSDYVNDVLQNSLVASCSKDHDKAETRLAQRRAARVEAREMRLKELEKTQQDEEEENDEEKQYIDNDSSSAIDKRMKKNSHRLQSPANSKTPSRPTRTSVGRTSLVSNSLNQISRRSSEDSIPDDALPGFAKELKSELKEMEEKFRKAMITNSQLDNEKATLTYEVEFLKDKFSELEELHIQLTKEHRRKCSENDQLRKLSNKLKEEMKMLRKILQEREGLIQEYGLVVVGEEENGEGSETDDDELLDDTINNLSPRKIAIKKALLSQEAADLLSRGAANGSLDVRLKRYAEEKNELEDEVRRLKMELEEEVHRRRKENGLDNEKQKETSTYINDYKLRIQKSEAEVSTLQANVARLESLVTRYKAQSEELEKSEDELKTERRKILREYREAQTRLEETELINSHLQKRFDKLKTARSTLLKDLSLDPA